MKNILKIILYFHIFSFLSATNFDVKVIENPTPTFSEFSNSKSLSLEKSIENIGDNEYKVFAGIQSIAIDESGNHYILDTKHSTIIKMNPEFKFLKSIGRKGEGPGEFRIIAGTPNEVSIGLDKNIYVVNFMGKRLTKFSIDGTYLKDFKFEQFLPFRLIVDENGNFYIPSVKGSILDIHDPDMKYIKSFLPGSYLKTFLFFKPPACVIIRRTIPSLYNIRYDFLHSKELVILNQYDLSVTILNPKTGKIIKKFYAWDDYILSEFKKKIKKTLDSEKKSGYICGYYSAFVSFFIDYEDNIYLELVDNSLGQYLYKFSRNGELLKVYEIKPAVEIDGIPYFFQYKANKFYSYTHYGIHIFKE